jgi:nucleotide-binding universal stress UspA family protein
MTSNTEFPSSVVPELTSHLSRASGALPLARAARFDLSGRVVLLAVDDSPASVAAVRVARELADQCGVVIHAVSVLDSRSAPIPPPLDAAIGIADAVIGPEVRAQREAELRDRLAAIVPETRAWKASVCVGSPAAEIAARAEANGAALIVMGIRRHGRIERAFQDETTLNTIRTAKCPVLAISAGTEHIPRHVLAAVDFGVVSTEAVRVTHALVARGGTIHLAYVTPSFRYRHGDGEAVIHALGVASGFEMLKQELSSANVAVEYIVLQHDIQQRVSEILLDFADACHADLICMGSVGHTLLDRWMLGSVSREIIRDGRTSLLINPVPSG